MISTITLRCPRCKRIMEAQRESHDPEKATIAEVLCPECADETMAFEPTTDYYDDQGNPVDWWAENK